MHCRSRAKFLFDYAKKVFEANFEYDITILRLGPNLEYIIGWSRDGH